jgi:SAM-dependent methyltransferase
LVKRPVSWFSRWVLRDPGAHWDHQYRRGQGEKLKSPAELARLDACADLLRCHANGGCILEIGSGEGLLQRQLQPNDYASWLGIDVSGVAVARAQEFAGDRVHYCTGDMNHFCPDEKFDAIVFPGSIYYALDAGQVLQRYAPYLRKGGVFIVSLFATSQSVMIWRELHALTKLVDARVTNNELGRWDCEVLRLK